MRRASKTRLFILLAASVLLALVVAACGGKGSSSETSKAAAPANSIKGATVTMWVMNNGPHPDEDTQRILQPFEQQTGVKVDVKRITSPDIDVASTVLSYASDASTDLIVMGGYGHSRLREFVLGGVTREILESMTVPVLMSH